MYRQVGFTLIELMLALAISTIMLAIGYPTYAHYQANAQRNRAEVALMQLSADLESYFSDQYTYNGATIKSLHANALTQGLEYRLRIAKATDRHYAIQAIPIGMQAERDSDCGTLSLSDTNERGISGDGNVIQCWL